MLYTTHIYLCVLREQTFYQYKICLNKFPTYIILMFHQNLTFFFKHILSILYFISLYIIITNVFVERYITTLVIAVNIYHLLLISFVFAYLLYVCVPILQTLPALLWSTMFM